MRIPLLPAAALLALLGCNQAPQDPGPVLLNVGGQKVNEAEFVGLVKALWPANAQDILNPTRPGAQAERAGILGGVAQERAVLAYARQTGLDQTDLYKILLEKAKAQVAMQILISQRTPAVAEPTEAQLKEVYLAFKSKSPQGAAAGFPTFEEVLGNPAIRAQFAAAWKQQQQQQLKLQQQAAFEQLIKEIKGQVPVTFAEGYQPVE